MHTALPTHFRDTPPRRLGVAVSGGGDSMALLELAADYAAEQGISLVALSVDHGLRPEAASEVAHVAQRCAALGVPHHVLTWTGWDGQGNLQDQARRARYRLMADCVHQIGVQDVLLGHTGCDQAETLIMRLSRGAGVDGLTGMQPRRNAYGVTWHRPLLSVSRDQLRDLLRSRGLTWADDPSNDDTRYQRIRARRALAGLAETGLTSAALGQVARNMANAQAALEWQTDRAAHDVAAVRLGAVIFDRTKLAHYPDEIVRRLTLRAISLIAGAGYGPRQAALDGFIAALMSGQTATLDGCQTCDHEGRAWVFREYQAVKGLACGINTAWDGRWHVTHSGADTAGVQVRALGPEALTNLPDWRAHGAPRAALIALPALFCAEDFIAAPLLQAHNGWQIEAQDNSDNVFPGSVTH